MGRSESATEADLVAECKMAAEAMNVYVERIGQHRADRAGQDRGAPDMLVYVAGRCLPVEFKRAKAPDGTPAGKLSLAQIVAIERRQAQHVETHVVTSLDDFVDVVNSCRRQTWRAAR